MPATGIIGQELGTWISGDYTSDQMKKAEGKTMTTSCKK